VDDGWSLIGNDGVDDVTIAINSSLNKFSGSHHNASMLPTFGGGVLCAKASMLLQVHPISNHAKLSFLSKLIWYQFQ